MSLEQNSFTPINIPDACESVTMSTNRENLKNFINTQNGEKGGGENAVQVRTAHRILVNLMESVHLGHLGVDGM
jgi:hypothetical protein